MKLWRVSVAAIYVALWICAGAWSERVSSVAAMPAQGGSGGGFVGSWCAQGNRAKRASIASNGVYFTLTNENGDTSTGHLMGVNQDTIVADGWQFVQGKLSGNGRQINWSNGTYWTRCDGRGGGGGGHNRPPSVDGTWYQSGNRSKACYIRQRGGNLSLTNEAGDKASGSFDDKRHITTTWGGTQIGGTLSQRGDRIDWDNGTYWTR